MSLRINFTQENILSHRPERPGERIVLLDTKVDGLQCRITHKGTITFSVYKRVKNGRTERVTLGKFPHLKIEAARTLAKVINASIAQGDNPAQVKRAHKAELTVDELFNEYFENHSKVHKRSWRDDECRYRLYLKPLIGNRKLSHVLNEDIRQLHTSISKRKRVFKRKKTDSDIKSLKTTANRVLSLISSMYSWAVRNGYCKENPVAGIQKFPEKSRDRFLQPEELEKFFTAVNEEPNQSIRDYVLISLYTGARRSNVLSMQWKDVSLQHKIWRIPNTKNSEPHVIPLIEEAIDILRFRQDNGSDFVFPSDSKTGHLLDPKNGWMRILERSGITDLRLHDLRRTLGSWQAIMGSSTLIIGKSLGHKSQKATEVYARLNLDPVRKSIETATKAMFQSVNKSTNNQPNEINMY